MGAAAWEAHGADFLQQQAKQHPPGEALESFRAAHSWSLSCSLGTIVVYY